MIRDLALPGLSMLAAATPVVLQQELVGNVERLTGLAAFILVVLWLGKKIYDNGERLDKSVQANTNATERSAQAALQSAHASERVAKAVELFCEQVKTANAAVLASQNSLAGEIMRPLQKVEQGIETLLRRVSTNDDARRPQRPDNGGQEAPSV